MSSALPKPLSEGGFSPGEILAGRYRIVGLLGRGGMGEVYRADDLRLGQSVALKFLAREVESDPQALALLHQEVRNARQVSHPHVCRVYDVDDAAGRHFLTMEYVDGEDLAALLRRIGRLPATKSIEIARQVCAGLQAVHDRGILHRDLKPGNVMIDGHGRARITDFGLAVSGAQRAGEVAGTPAYMAPEQLAGQPATAQSDIYALGLLLYEICTGRRPFDGKSLAEWTRAHTHDLPESPSLHVRELPDAVERVILRCLEKDPARRPRSAARVALALSGGDPLAAAVAAGETPSPGMVAASSLEGALSNGQALAAFAGVAALLVSLAFASKVNLYRRVPFEKPAEALADRAATLITDLGFEGTPADRAWGFGRDLAYLAWKDDPVKGPARWRRLEKGQPISYFFWYRQSPVSLEPLSFGGSRGQIAPDDPPVSVEGMVSARLDLRGRLVELRAVPPAAAGSQSSPSVSAAWPRLFSAAGLDPSRFTPVEPRWTPPVFADQRLAWSGVYPDHPDLAVRIEAGSHRGRPVFFRVVAPWDEPPTSYRDGQERGQVAAGIIAVCLVVGILAAAVVRARKNLRIGRGDRMGARRIAAFTGAAASAAAILRSDLPLTLAGVAGDLLLVLHSGLLVAASTWVLYVALEPVVRRRQPHLIVSWSRLLGGETRDPLIGRDVLMGLLLGLATTAANYLGGWLKVWTASPVNPSYYLQVETLNGVRHAVVEILDVGSYGIWTVLAVLVFLVLARNLLRRDWAAVSVLWAVMLSMSVLFAVRSWPAVTAEAIVFAIQIGTLARLGLVAGLAANLAFRLTAFFPLTADLSAPYASASLTSLVVILALAAYGFRVSRGSAPMPDAD